MTLITPESKKIIVISLLAITVVFGGFGILIWGGKQRQKAAWDNPEYHRDPRAPKICMCLWERSAFRVPCEDIPPELLKE